MEFASRQDAGRKLGAYLKEHGIRADLVLGLPRGGVIVAAEVAQALHAPLDVIVVRKIGHPRQREYAVGALAEGDVVLLDRDAMERSHVIEEELDDIIVEEKQRLAEYQSKFEQQAMINLEGKTVLIVDDGIATGLTTEAAVLSAKNRNAQSVLVGVPVSSDSAYSRLRKVADHVYALLVDPTFDAVGRYYWEFTQTTDEEVLEVLNATRNHHRG